MLFTRFFIALLLVSAVPVAANVYQFWQAQSTIRDKVNTQLVSTAEKIVSDVNHWVELNLRSSELIARTSQIQSMEPAQQVPILKATDDTFDWSYTAFTADLEGNAVARSDGKPLKYYGDREYVRAILSGQQVGQQVLISRVNDKPALCLSVPIQREQALVGILVQCSKLVNISAAVASVQIGETGLARLEDNKQRLIAHGDTRELTTELKDLSNDPINELGLNREPIISNINGNRVVSYTIATDLNWRLSIVQEYEEAYAVLEKLKFEAMIAGGVLLFIILFFALLLSNSISKPIRQLSDIANTYSKGGLDQEIPGTKRRDEIGDLARAIERLGLGLKVIIKRYTDINKKYNEVTRIR